MTEGIPAQNEEAFLKTLISRGLAPDEAQLWLQLCTISIRYIHGAEGLLKDGWQEFLAKIEAQRVAAKDKAKRTTRKRAPKGVAKARLPEETDITVELYHHMDVVRGRSELTDGLRQIEPKCDDPIPAPTRTGKYSRKPDLTFIHMATREKVVFEAKRLLDGSSIQAYRGLEGMGCFSSTDSPYSTGPIVGMLGYVLEDNVINWHTKLKDSGIVFAAIFGPVTLPVSVPYSWYDRTALKLNEAAMFHYLADFTPSSAKS
ncbi:MAG TPA: hypothetical protein VF651_05880 [Gammaproteobacteria bacterium]